METMESKSAFQKLLSQNRNVVNKARLNQCLFEVTGSYKPLPGPDEEYVHSTLEPYPDFSDELYDRIKERKLFPIRIRTRPGNMKAYIKVVFRNGVEECYDIKAAIKLLPPIISGRAPIQWATDTSYCPSDFNGPFMYKGHMIAFLDDELICLFTTGHFWAERNKFIQKHNSNVNVVSIDQMTAFETPFMEYVKYDWFAPADLKLQEKTYQELQQTLKEAREERRIDCKPYEEAPFDTIGLSKEERQKVLKKYESYLFHESLDRGTITFEFEEEPALSTKEACKQIVEMTKRSSSSMKRKLNQVATTGEILEELLAKSIIQKNTVESGCLYNPAIDGDNINDHPAYSAFISRVLERPLNDVKMSDHYWQDREIPPWEQKCESMFQPVEVDINRPVDFETGLNSTDEWVSNLVQKPLMRRKHMKKLGLIEHKNFYKCLSDEDKAALDNFTIEKATASCSMKKPETLKHRPNSALPSTNEQTEKLASDPCNSRPKSANPAVPLFWDTKRYLQKISRRKKYEELQYVDIEAMGFTF